MWYSFLGRFNYIFVFRAAVKHLDCLMLVLNVGLIQDTGVLESRNQAHSIWMSDFFVLTICTSKVFSISDTYPYSICVAGSGMRLTSTFDCSIIN